MKYRLNCFLLIKNALGLLDFSPNKSRAYLVSHKKFMASNGSFHRAFSRFVAAQSEIRNLVRLQLKLELVRNQGDELTVSGFSLGITDSIAEKSLQSIQIPSVPCHFDGMADGPLHAAGGGLECFRHLGVEYLGDGIDHVHVIDGDDDRLS